MSSEPQKEALSGQVVGSRARKQLSDHERLFLIRVVDFGSDKLAAELAYGCLAWSLV